MIRPAYRQRFRVVDGSAALGKPGLHDGFDLLVGALDDPHSVEVALASVAFAPLLVCMDWADVMCVSGGGIGLARVVPRVFGAAADLRTARDNLAASGFGLGFLFVQLPDPTDWRYYELEELDGLANDLFASTTAPVSFTATQGRIWRSCSVLIGFGTGRQD